MNIDDAKRSGIGHSCYPNCLVHISGKLQLFEPILPGTPLTIDYSTLFVGNEFTFHCNCGRNGCRKVILGFEQLPVFFQEKYLKYNGLPFDILKIVENMHNKTHAVSPKKTPLKH